MTVYVDDARIPATVGTLTANWSHLFADTQAELHEFAAGIGLQRAWFQPGTAYGDRPSPYWNYAVTDNKRRQAIRAGAQSVTAREAVRIIRRRAPQAAAAAGKDTTR
ncbi:hypothetical protein GCM10023191_101690 [Actinoallomurus oryzae]|uniref:DUF4031 domain-containing protein n=1 Tax=Actinoallomurus oryzae TaxID=502180 RepID=A0ABP8R9L2_9ACTN